MTVYETKLKKARKFGYPAKIKNRFDAVFTQLQTGAKL